MGDNSAVLGIMKGSVKLLKKKKYKISKIIKYTKKFISRTAFYFVSLGDYNQEK